MRGRFIFYICGLEDTRALLRIGTAHPPPPTDSPQMLTKLGCLLLIVYCILNIGQRVHICDDPNTRCTSLSCVSVWPGDLECLCPGAVSEKLKIFCCQNGRASKKVLVGIGYLEPFGTQEK